MSTEDIMRNLTSVCIPELIKDRNWNIVFKYVEGYHTVISQLKGIKFISDFLLDCLITYGCNDVADVQRTLRIAECCRLPFLVDDDVFTWKPLSCSSEKDASLLNSSLCLTMRTALENVDVKLAIVALKFGYHSTAVEPDIELERYSIINTLEKFCEYIPSHLYEEEEGLELAYSIEWILAKTDGRMLGQNQRGFQRICFLVMALQAVIYKMEDNPKASDSVQCFRLFFTIHSKPFVSMDEMEEFLLYLFQNQPADLVDKILEIFSVLFLPECAVPYCPRALKHLSRFAVRRTLLKKMPSLLPELIGKLNVPRSLKYFLMGVKVQ